MKISNRTYKSSRKLVIPTGLILLLIAFIALFRGVAELRENFMTKINNADISLIWDAGDYERIIELTEGELIDSPLNVLALVYCGFSYFYKGISQVSNERAIPLFNRSIFLLRKVLVLDVVPMRSRIHYVLGKAYLHKDYYYADLAVEHLQKSISSGYVNKDSYEYIGQAYSLLGDYEKSIEYYLKALEDHTSDMLYLKIAEDYMQNRLYDHSEKYLKLMIETTRDELLKKKGLFQLANLYYDMKNYLMAEKKLLELIELEKENENYHFLLGEVYLFLGDVSKARSHWHKVTRINPKHVDALRRLYD